MSGREREQPRSRISYPELLRSLHGLIRKEPVLRETSIFGALVFGAFSVFWVTLVFFGGSLGSLLGAYGWSKGRWNGVCAVGILMLVAGLVVYAVGSLRHGRSNASH